MENEHDLSKLPYLLESEKEQAVMLIESYLSQGKPVGALLQFASFESFAKSFFVYYFEGDEHITISQLFCRFADYFRESPDDILQLITATAFQIEILKFQIHDDRHLLHSISIGQKLYHHTPRECIFETDLFFAASTCHLKTITMILDTVKDGMDEVDFVINTIHSALHYNATDFEYFKGYIEYAEFCGHAAWFLGEFGTSKELELLGRVNSIPREIALKLPDGTERIGFVNDFVREAIEKIMRRKSSDNE